MNATVQTIILRSDEHYGRYAPAEPLGWVIREIAPAVRYSIRMAFGLRSRAGGRLPSWLAASSDIRLVDYQGRDETVLSFQVPILGEAAPQLYEQQEFWPSKPDPADTGFDLLADVIGEVRAGNSNSARFDEPLLRRLFGFRKCLAGPFRELLITGRRYPKKSPCVLNASVIENAARLSSATPPPQQARVAGTLDMIRASTQTFALKLEEGQEVGGVLLSGNMDLLKELFRQRVLVLGKAVYRPSGRLLRIDAHEVRKASEAERFFTTVPRPVSSRLDMGRVLGEQSQKKGLAAVFGKWPGDETDEQIEQALRELS